METHSRKKTCRLFRRYDGLYLYLRHSGAWSSSPVIESTNDAVEACNHEDHRLGRMIDQSEGEWVDAVVRTVVNVES